MIDDNDDDDFDGSEREEVARLVRTEGLRIAYDAAVAVCKDANAPAAARATAASLIFRAGGLLASNAPEAEKPLHELTAAELAQRADKVRSRLEAMERARARARARAPTIFD